MKRRAARTVQTPEPLLRARLEGTPSPAALESLAAFLLERIQRTQARPQLRVVANEKSHQD